ncbi:MAG: GNAT family N-acetyltransferase [Chloroflexota bacterium]
MTDQSLARRALEAEMAAFIDLYKAAASACNTSHDSFDGVHVVWGPEDPSPAFSPVLNLQDARQVETTLHVLEELGRERGMPRIGINGHPDIEPFHGRLADLGYEIDDHEHYWALPMSGEPEAVQLSEGATLEIVEPDQAAVFASTLNRGHEKKEDHARGRVYAAAIGRQNWRHYLIRVDGEPAAASALYIAGDAAQLFVTATVPEFRSRGFQTSLIRQRLKDGREEGCTIAACQTVTDNASPRNMQRHGFQMLYTRAIHGKLL